MTSPRNSNFRIGFPGSDFPGRKIVVSSGCPKWIFLRISSKYHVPTGREISIVPLNLPRGYIVGRRGGVNPCHIHICPPNTLKCPQNCKNTNFKQILQRYSENYTYNFGVTSSNHNIFDDFEFFFMYIIENIFFVWTSSV